MEVLVDGKAVPLGRRLGKGGEGEVYAVEGAASIAAKIYTVTNLGDREQKVIASIAKDLSSKIPLAAFPKAILRWPDGRFAGFFMKLIPDHKPVHELYPPGSRKHHFPRADYRFLVRAANNVARAFAQVHEQKCVVGDINHSSILISKNATAALIDADSFQFESAGKVFLCKVGVPEYTPPELQGQALGSIVRTENHDRFGLSVVIFQLLFMGRQPFVGSIRNGEMPPMQDLIKNFRFAYSEMRNVGMDQPPGTPVLSDFSPRIASAFETAFSPSGVQSRPSAKDWISILDELESLLIQCGKNKLHHYSKKASECPWCELEYRLSTVLFLPFVPDAVLVTTPFDPGANNFDLTRTWAQIELALGGALKTIGPKIPTAPNVTPSGKAVAAKGEANKTNAWARVLAGVGAIIGFILFPPGFILWIPLGGWAALSSTKKGTVDSQPFLSLYVEVERKWLKALEAWKNRSGWNALAELHSKLLVSKTSYQNLATEERQRIESYTNSRKARQLSAHFDNFEIRNSKIRGIGPALVTSLASFGIETAEHVSLDAVLRVPGIGQTKAAALMDWRTRIEKRFVFRNELSDLDRREVGRLRSEIATKGNALRRELLSGAANISNLKARLSTFATSEDQLLSRIFLEKTQAKCDLEFLGISIPQVSIPQTSPVPIGSQQALFTPPVSVPSPSLGAPPTCPRCGSSMVGRVARRGAQAGNRFWGCSRYPVCKGTRN